MGSPGSPVATFRSAVTGPGFISQRADGPIRFGCARTAFHEQLDALIETLSRMCDLAGVAMARATHALLQADLVVAEQVARYP